MANKTCPVCKKPLSLHQINMNLAVYMCEDLDCKYPVGYDCIVIERKLEDMDKTVEVFSEENCDLDDWVDDITIDNDKTPSEPVTAVEASAPKPSEENTEWIDNLVEEAVTKVRNQSPTDDSLQTDYDDILNFIHF